jgi:hypothetical protein
MCVAKVIADHCLAQQQGLTAGVAASAAHSHRDAACC